MSEERLASLTAKAENQENTINEIKEVLRELLKATNEIKLALTKVEFLTKKDYEQDSRISKLETDVSQLKVWKTVSIAIAGLALFLLTSDLDFIQRIFAP